jgi:hypothetical protein
MIGVGGWSGSLPDTQRLLLSFLAGIERIRHPRRFTQKGRVTMTDSKTIPLNELYARYPIQRDYAAQIVAEHLIKSRALPDWEAVYFDFEDTEAGDLVLIVRQDNEVAFPTFGCVADD